MKKIAFLFLLSIICVINHEVKSQELLEPQVYYLENMNFYTNKDNSVLAYTNSTENPVYYEWTKISGNFTFRSMTARTASVYSATAGFIEFKYEARYANGEEIIMYVSGNMNRTGTGGGGEQPPFTGNELLP